MTNIKYVAISPKGNTVLIDTPFTHFARKMGWNTCSAQNGFHVNGKYKGWQFRHYNSDNKPELRLDDEILSRFSSVKFVFRSHFINDKVHGWSAYIYPDLLTSVASEIIRDPNTDGYKWNCYNGCEGVSRTEVARKIMAALDTERMKLG